MGHKIDNSNSTIQKLNTLYCDPELSDLRLLVGERTFHAHKLILSISSDVFKTMLTSPTWPEAYTNQIVLEEEPECVDVFGDFLWYLYTGHIHLSQESVLSVLILADKYNIKDLSDVCIRYMCQHYVAPCPLSHVVSWLKYAIMCDHRDLRDVCEQYIRWNFQTIMETEDFMNISPDMIIDFLRCPEVVVDSEYGLYRKICRWIQAKVINRELRLKSKRPALNLEKFVKEVAELIDFNMMSSAELTAILKDDIVNQFSHILLPKVMQAFTFHEKKQCCKCQTVNEAEINHTEGSTGIPLSRASSEPTNFPAGVENHYTKHLYCRGPRMCNSQKRMRNYTSDAWSTEMTVTDISSMNPGDMQGAFFSTPITGSEADETCWDWHIDLYPKGVIFKKCMMIGVYGNYELDEVVYDTVRLTVISNSMEARHAKISILVYGEQEGLEYISRCITKYCFFDSSHTLQNFNDVVDFAELQKASPNSCSMKIKIVIRPMHSN